MKESNVVGIWSEEDKKDERFVRFFHIVQGKAEEKGCVFFLWAGEGNEISTEDLEGENLSGWLVPKDNASSFEAIWKTDRLKLDGKFDENMCVAEWNTNDKNGIDINFRFW